MKKTSLLNEELSRAIASLGHTDGIAIGDCGLPIPKEAIRIDLALKKGSPTFLDTLNTVLEELCVERVVLAEEIRTVSPGMLEGIQQSLLLPETSYEYISHEDFKRKLKEVKYVIRTGECTPYANIILVCGVAF